MEKSLRVAVISSSYPRFPGDGTAPFVKSISDQLVKIGYDVEVVAPYDTEVKDVDPNGVRVHRFRYIWPDQLHIMGHARALKNDTSLSPLAFILLPLFLLSAFWNLLLVTIRQKSQIIYAHWVIPNGLIAAWVASIRKIPFIISLHGSDIFVAGRNPLFRSIARWVFQRADAVTACSYDLKQKAISLGAPPDTLLLAWGADPVRFHPHLTKQESEDHPLVIATLGRMVAKKGFNNLLNAVSRVLKDSPSLMVIIGGEGSLKENLKQQAIRAGISKNVIFPGRISWDEVPEFLAGADIFVLPSIADKKGNVDGLPTVLLEAMSSGCAIVASDIGGVSLVIDHGANGVLVQPGDIDALAEAIQDLIMNPQKRAMIARAARKSILETYNWESVTQIIASLLDQAVST
jgi:glycosyltransferase involved in cell wall biosynthesis